jgi:hypothetical protein
LSLSSRERERERERGGREERESELKFILKTLNSLFSVIEWTENNCKLFLIHMDRK